MWDQYKSFLRSSVKKKNGGALIYMGPAQQFYNFISLSDPKKPNRGALILYSFYFSFFAFSLHPINKRKNASSALFSFLLFWKKLPF